MITNGCNDDDTGIYNTCIYTGIYNTCRYIVYIHGIVGYTTNWLSHTGTNEAVCYLFCVANGKNVDGYLLAVNNFV